MRPVLLLMTIQTVQWAKAPGTHGVGGTVRGPRKGATVGRTELFPRGVTVAKRGDL